MNITIPFGEWLPDMPATHNPGCEVADNVIAVASGYAPFPARVDSGETVAQAVVGAQQIFDTGGNSVLVGGTIDSLFVRRSAFTETTGLTSIGLGQAWDFAQFNDYVIATGDGNNPKYLSDVDSDNTWSDLPGSPPPARRCARVGEFLMLGYVSGVPSKIQWSHYNDPTASWALSRLTQAGSATLPVSDGAIQRIVGGRYATIFQQRAITRLSYVGPPIVFRSDVISAERGATAPFAVVSVGYLTYFLAQDGFFVTNGSSVEPIGNRRVNDWFFRNVDQGAIQEVQGAVDWQNQCIVWALRTTGSSGFNKLIIYNYNEARWSTATVSLDWLVSSALDGVNIDSLDAIYGDLDSIPLSLDSAEFKAKDRRLAAFTYDSVADTSEYSTFTGEPLEATWETMEFQPAPGQRVFVRGVQPVMQAETWDCRVTLLMRDHRGAQSFSNTLTTGWGGFAPVRGEGHRMAVRLVKPSGDWQDAVGVDVEFRPAGRR